MKMPWDPHIPESRLTAIADLPLDHAPDPADTAHLAGCARCAARLGAHRRIAGRLAGVWAETHVARAIDTGAPNAASRPRVRTAAQLSPAIALGAVVLIAVGLVAPRLLFPGAAPGVSQASGSPSATASSQTTPVPATPRPTIVPNAVDLTTDPMEWSPDGAYLIAGWPGSYGPGMPGNRIQILDESGRVIGTHAGDDATWFDPNTVAVVTLTSPDKNNAARVTLIDTSGHDLRTLPGTFIEGADTTEQNGPMLFGSGRGELAILDASASSPSDWSFVLWDGEALSAPRAGIPLAWSDSHLAVLLGQSTTGCCGTRWVQGSVEVLTIPDLRSEDLGTEVPGAFEAAGRPTVAEPVDTSASFSPDGRYLLSSGTVVDLRDGTSWIAGPGGWLPDNTLLAASGDQILRWQGSSGVPDPRFEPGGVPEVSRSGVVVECFPDRRPGLLVLLDGQVRNLTLPKIELLDSVMISPNGQVLAVTGEDLNSGYYVQLIRLP
jgi:hypothetical protein